jgi:predicted RND superfamily exporter protein
MNYYFLIAGIALFTIVIVIYFYFSFTKYRKAPDLGDGVSLFLSCNGISAGAKVGYLGLMAQPATIYSDDRIYILLGGLAVVWVSIQTILTTIAFSDNS